MGKSEERNGNTIQAGESTFLTKTSSEASKMLEAALLQMDDIISGKLWLLIWNNFSKSVWKYIIISLGIIRVIKNLKYNKIFHCINPLIYQRISYLKRIYYMTILYLKYK